MRTGGLISFVTVALAAVIVIATPELPVPPHPDFMECHYSTDPNNHYCRFLTLATTISREVADFIQRNRDLIAALAAVAIAAFAFALWRSNRDARRDTDRFLRITQRAYLAVEPLGIVPMRGGRRPTSVAQIGIENVGLLPAREVRWQIRIAFDTDDQRPATGLDLRPVRLEGNHLIVPGATMGQMSDIFSFPEAMIEELKSYVLYVYGVVTYHDGFQPDRSTHFCHRYECRYLEPERGSGTMGIPARYALYHRFGNRAD